MKQECDLTLNHGLEIHYNVNPTFKRNVELVPAFYNHDIVHVLFGLDTSPGNEALTDTRVIFSTNWGFKNYINDYFRNPNATKIILQIMKDIGFIKSFILPLIYIPKIFRIIIDSRKMHKKWKINPDENLLNTPLTDLRNKYNISVIN